jgi:hypothetical protein
MAYTIDLVKDSKYISLLFTGEVTMNDVEKARDEVDIALNANSWNRLLVDISLTKMKMSFLEHFKFTSEHQSHFPKGGQLALVVRQDEMGYYKFIEDVSKNRGVNLKLFSEKTQACNWLIPQN